MQALTILHHVLSTSFPEIHAKRLASLLAEVNDPVFHMIQWHYLPMLAAGLLGLQLGRTLLKW